MPDIHPAAELAPRDVVARGIARQMALQQGLPVLLDATPLSADFLAHRFPSIDAETRARNLDWSREPIPVTPAAHYWMGGVRTDTHGRSSIPGLYAVGEVACTGVHGANRLASNSLLESLTFAWRCAHLLLQSDSPSADLTPFIGTPTSIQKVEHQTTPITRLELQTLLWTRTGIERNATDLSSALHTLAGADVEGITVYDLETTNLLALGRVLVTAALAREESRGAHFRTDFPEPSLAFQHSRIYAQKVKRLRSAPARSPSHADATEPPGRRRHRPHGTPRGRTLGRPHFTEPHPRYRHYYCAAHGARTRLLLRPGHRLRSLFSHRPRDHY